MAQWVKFTRYSTGQKCIKIALDIAVHRHDDFLKVGNREDMKQVHEHHNRLVDFFRRVTSNHHVRREEEQLVLEAVNQKQPRTGAPSRHGYIRKS